jgi:NADH-quinone oxidoreductase subunit G
VPLLAVHDLFPTPLSEAARYVLPAGTFAEKDGTFVNHANLAQSLHWAIRAPMGTRTDGQIFLDLQQRRGLVHAPTIRREMAGEIGYFAPLAGELDSEGIVLGTPH